ncbi:MAG: type II toxin-antitoxin system HicA family toxin [Geminicoccaceae bacterium]
MSGRLPSLGARQVIRALERAGFFIERSSGSHHLLVHGADPRRRVIVAYHGSREIPRRTLSNTPPAGPADCR